MAKTQANVKEPYSPNTRVLAAKLERRLEKSNYSPAKKIEIATKLRDTERSLRSASLIEKGKVICD